MPEPDLSLRGELFIGGEWAPSRSRTTFDVVDPSTEEVIASVARGDRDDVHEAVGAAKAAFAGPLRSVDPAERGRLMSRLARLVESRAEELAQLESRDTGKPLSLARGEIAKGTYTNSGQYCDAGSRLLVHRPIHRPLLDRLVAHSERLRIGPGTDDPDLGPLISAAQRERVLGYIEAGRDEGARVRTPREVDLPRGYFVAPTILDEARPHMRVAREEIFGPVLTVLPFDTETEAADIAHATDYGLAAGIFTRDLDRALRFARDIRAGYVMVNEYFAGGVESPFGGSKHSGYGRERGLAALDNYTRLKTVVLRIREE